MEQIVICGNRVELQEVQSKRCITTSAFRESLRKSMGIATPILPRRVILYAARGGNHFYLVEREPKVETIKVKQGKSGATTQVKEYTICLPWVYMLLEFTGASFDRLKIFFAKSRLLKTGAILYYPPLPNLNNDCTVCLGGGFRFSIEGTMQSKVTKVESYYFTSEFNSDLDDIHKSRMPREIMETRTRSKTLFEAWEIVTRSGTDACSLSWHKHKTLADVIERVVGEGVV